MPGFAQRYGPQLLITALVVLGTLAFRLAQPLATPPAIAGLGPGLSAATQALDAGLRAGLGAVASAPLDAVFAAVLLGLHPAMLVLVPALALASDEERAARVALAGVVAFLVLTIPLHFVLPVQLAQDRPWPFLEEVGALYYPAGDDDKVPSLNAGLALVLALAARRSHNARFRPLAFAYPALVVPALLYFGVNGTLGVFTGLGVAVLAAALGERATSVERIVHQRIDASPERKMEVRQAAEALLGALRKAAGERGWACEPRLVGSVAKDTFLAHKVDIDAFLLFPPETQRRQLEEQGLELGRAVLAQPEARFAEHPYLAGKWQGLDAEVVPAFRIPEGARVMSAVDRTPFHTDYVVRRLEGLQRRDVRLLKQFLAGIGVYGAETKVQGFSGYLAELLVLKCGSFRAVLEQGSAWPVGKLLALEPFEGAPAFPDPLVVIDPVDPRRNVASALSLENFLLFQEAAKDYLREPRVSFFFPRPVVPLPPPRLREAVRKRGQALLGVSLERPDVLDDSLHAQLRKAGQALQAELERGGFKVLGRAAVADERSATVLLALESLTVNEREVHEGPPVRSGTHAERFRAKWTGNPRALSAVYEEQGKLWVARRREFTNAGALLQSRAASLDVGKDLSAVVRAKGLEVLDTEACVQRLDGAFLTGFVRRSRPWER